MSESKDFYIENGNTVFTKDFLSRRGYCCKNGCRHCPYEFTNNKKVISLVPSWTETLIQAGVNVVGRTKFCIHPKKEALEIPIVGGTKNVDFKKINNIDADLVLLDREENRKEFLQNIKQRCFVTNVRSVEDVKISLIDLNRILKNEKINEYISFFDRVNLDLAYAYKITDIPGVLQWIKKPNESIDNIVYMIWKNPWMAMGRKTYISSVFKLLGFGDEYIKSEDKYPEINIQDLDKEKTIIFFSTEPYPFEKNIHEIKELGYFSALLNGETYSWYGYRTIQLIKSLIK
ncbi:MAG: Fe3+-siderophores ABC transporter protein [Bdellovibrionales bacterium]|nr:Fe3+-siderophores ABC transporter protein [Bdellovibrionales bacterium]